MRKIFFSVALLFSSTLIFSDSLGICYGPLVNEELIIEQSGPVVAFYDMPLFIGGLYYRTSLGGERNIISHSDISFNIHNTQAATGELYPNYIIYLHQDFSIFPGNQNIAFLGLGGEAMAVIRDYNDGEQGDYDAFVTSHGFLYGTLGLNFTIAESFEFGLKTNIRLFPYSIYVDTPGNGELQLLLGYKFN